MEFGPEQTGVCRKSGELHQLVPGCPEGHAGGRGGGADLVYQCSVMKYEVEHLFPICSTSRQKILGAAPPDCRVPQILPSPRSALRDANLSLVQVPAYIFTEITHEL